jgi:ribosomal-protein-alanine N-acetyltransferase
MYNFYPFPTLHTERLILRKVVPEDAPDIFVMRSDAEVMRYIPRPIAQVVDDVLPVLGMMTEGLDKGAKINWGITEKGTDKVIGMVGFVNTKFEHFRAELGYSLTRSYHRQGIMREAVLRVIQYGFEEMKLHTIEAIIEAENVASGGLLESVGFRKEAYFREDFYFNGGFRNSIHYGLLQSDVYG